MKKSIIALSLLGGFSVLGLTSCDKIKDKLFPAFETEISEVSVSIPITAAGVEASSSSTVAFNLDSAIKANTGSTFSIDNISSVKVKDVTISINNPDDENDVSNFEAVSLKFSSNTVSTPAVVASASIPDNTAYSLNITPTDSPELKEYLKGNELTYTVSGTARRSTTKALDATVDVTLSVK